MSVYRSTSSAPKGGGCSLVYLGISQSNIIQIKILCSFLSCNISKYALIHQAPATLKYKSLVETLSEAWVTRDHC